MDKLRYGVIHIMRAILSATHTLRPVVASYHYKNIKGHQKGLVMGWSCHLAGLTLLPVYPIIYIIHTRPTSLQVLSGCYT